MQGEDIPKNGNPWNVPLWVLMEEATLLVVACYGILQPLLTRGHESGIWEQLFCNMVIVSLILPAITLYFLRVEWWILKRWNYGERWQVLCVSFLSKEYFAGNWIAPRLWSAVPVWGAYAEAGTGAQDCLACAHLCVCGTDEAVWSASLFSLFLGWELSWPGWLMSLLGILVRK